MVVASKKQRVVPIGDGGVREGDGRQVWRWRVSEKDRGRVRHVAGDHVFGFVADVHGVFRSDARFAFVNLLTATLLLPVTGMVEKPTLSVDLATRLERTHDGHEVGGVAYAEASEGGEAHGLAL